MMRACSMVMRIFAVGLMWVFAGSAVAQQAYPNKLIRFIVPFAPGSTLDVLGRLLGPKFTEAWGQPVIVDTRPGGNSVIGVSAVLNSPPDGYTLLLNATTHVLTPLLLSPPPYDPVRDFAPVATISSNEFFLLVNSTVQANSLQELIALLKSQPGKFNFASTGVGGGPHMAAELFSFMAGVKMEHIPYNGGVPALTDLIGGRVQVFIYTTTVSVPYIKSGRVKAIAVSGETRSPAAPQVPTFTEAGLPGLSVKTWQGVLAPAGTPREIVNKLSTEVATIQGMSDIREKLAGLGADPFVSNADQFASLIKADVAKYTKIVKAANIKLQK